MELRKKETIGSRQLTRYSFEADRFLSTEKQKRDYEV